MGNKENTDAIFLSVIITAHSEGILAHRTLRCVIKAISKLDISKKSEIILHLDNATVAMQEYVDTNKDGILRGIKIYSNHFGDLGASRNFAVRAARGKYVATIDADDLMSENWLAKAVNYLESHNEPTIAHSEFTVEFEGANNLIVKHGEINYDTDTLLSVYANRWNSVIVASRKLLLEYPYTPNSPGYGYEDWNLNCRLIYGKVHNVLIPETAIFVRRKLVNSEWARQVQSMSVLRANPLLAFNNIRTIVDPFNKDPSNDSRPISNAKYTALSTIKSFIKRYPFTHRLARRVKRSLKRKTLTMRAGEPRVEPWLQGEWKKLHEIDRQIFPTASLMATIPVYDSITEDHKLTGSLYKALVTQLNFDEYDYLIFAPWLTKGGADQYTVDYANTIAHLTNKNVLVVATLPNNSPWKDKLSDSVDFLEFGKITERANQEMRHRLMEHIVENGNLKTLHVINSEFGYDFIRLHANYIKSSGKRVVATSFSQSIENSTGRKYGYSHTHVPFIYEIADIITSDNHAVVNMWINEYGFDPNKLLVHRQPLAIETTSSTTSNYTQHTPLRVLWAARVAPEKQPEIIREIGLRISDIATIDIFGTIDKECEQYIDNLPDNVTYQGSFDGIDNLDLKSYDAYLYTSLFDGMPYSILEMAQAGVPIIASAVGGIPEFIENNKTGFLVHDIDDPQAYADAIEQLHANPTLGDEYIQAAQRKIASNFSVSSYTSHVKQMLVRLGRETDNVK